MKAHATDWSLYLVTHRSLTAGRSLEDIVYQAVQGGVSVVQLREKDCSTRDFICLAQSLKALLGPLGVPLLINDRVDVALAAGADGVHLGQSDMPCALARKLLGPEALIGLSLESEDQVEEANSLDLNYVAVSPVFATPTKTNTAPALGLSGLRRMVESSLHPVVGIGGMNLHTVRSVMEAGAAGVAVVSAIVAAPDPCAAARQLRSLLV